MHQVFCDRILHVEDGTGDYVFECRSPVVVEHVEMSDLVDGLGLAVSKAQRDEAEISIFQSLPTPLHINGVTSSLVFAKVREAYRTLGYFNETLQCFEVPPETSPITIGIDLADAVYGKKNARVTPAATRSIVAAINDGIVTRIRIRKNSAALLSDYLLQSHVNLCRLAAAFDNGWRMTTWPMAEPFTLRIPYYSFPSVLSE